MLCAVRQWLWLQERRGSEITCKCILSDLRARYLHGLAAIIAEGFEKGFLNGEQHAAAHGVIATCLDHPENQISDFEALQKLVRTPIWLRAIVKTLSVLGRVVPPCERWSDQVRASPSGGRAACCAEAPNGGSGGVQPQFAHSRRALPRKARRRCSSST